MRYACNGDAIEYNGKLYHWNGEPNLRPPEVNEVLESGMMQFHGPCTRKAALKRVKINIGISHNSIATNDALYEYSLLIKRAIMNGNLTV